MLDDATMRQKALEMGLISTTKDALEPQQKILAAQALIMEKSNGVAGDFQKTMNSTANVSKRLEAAQTNLSAKIGAKLAPAFTAAKLRALDAVNGISSFIDRIDAAKAVAGGGGMSQDVAAALGFGPATTKFLAETIGSVRAFKAAVADPTAGVTSDGAAGVFERIGMVVGNAKMGVSAFFAALREGDVTSDGFVGALERAGAFLHQLGPTAIIPVVGTIGLLLASFGNLGPILAPIMGLFARIGPLVGQLGGMLKFLLGPIGILAALLIYAYSTSEPFRETINQLVSTLMTLAMTLVTSLMPIFTQLTSQVLPIVSQLFQSLVPILIQILGAVMPVIMAVASQLLPIFVQLIGAILPPLVGLLTMLAPVFTMLLQAIMPIIPPVMEIVMMLLNLAMQVITPLMPLVSMLAGLIGTVLGGAIEFLMPVIKFLLEAFVNLVTFLKGPLKIAIDVVVGIFKTLGDIIAGVMDGIGDFMSNPMGGIQDMLGIPKNSGGGVYAGGGVVGHKTFAGGGVLGGYAPGIDNIPALLSPGESVLVPELTRAIGPSNIMAANRMASQGRSAGSGPDLTGGYSNTSSAGGGATTVVESGAVQITIVAQDGKISDADIEKIRDIIEDIFDDAEGRGY
jgi:phage-related protein